MPYSGPGDDTLPENVKKLDEDKRAQWVDVFNSALAKCKKEDGKDCEASAFAQANGVVKEKRMDIKTLWESIKRLFAPLVEAEPEARAEILPTQTRSFVITRADDGTPRWLMIAASAVINKAGAIDSTVLFDSFIRKAPEFGYPVIDFIHKGNRIRFGVADHLWRDGALYVASGTFDDTDLARGAIEGLEKDPDYWGASISYRITAKPLHLSLEGSIPVYTDGVNDFISIVPKRMAANLFTATSVAKEVKRMDKAMFEELVKLVGAERAAQFAGEVDEANRTITETGLITRADAPPADAPPAEVTTTADVVRQDEQPPAESKPAVTLDELAARLTALETKLTELAQGAGAMQEESARVAPAIEALNTRLAGVESSKTRWDEWLNDAPEHIKREAETVYRARNQEPAPMTLAQIAEQTTSKFRHEPRQRHA